MDEMAARTKKIRHDENTKAKIQAGNIINRLQKFIMGDVQMSAPQVTAALGLLKKVEPDLTSVQHSGEITKTYVVRMPAKPANMDEWQQRYAPKLPQPTIQ
jgi:hypothetical protein